MPSDNTRQLQIKGGQAQIDQFPSWSTVAALKSTPGVQHGPVQFDARPTTWPSTRTSSRSRTCTCAGRSRWRSTAQAIIKAVLFGNGKPANSLFPPQVPYYDPTTPGYQYNLAAAKQQMAQSSVPHGFTTTMLLPSGNSDYATITTIVQAELKPLGITVKVQTARPEHRQRQLPEPEVRHEPDALDDGHPGPGRAGHLRASTRSPAPSRSSPATTTRRW